MTIDATDAGVLLVDKPAGRTSFSMVRAVRRLLSVKKVGHGGTLDPFATGLLVVCIGRPATKLIPRIMDGAKEYLATMELGRVSTTQDPEGEISVGGSLEGLTGARIEGVLEGYRGTIEQRPPPFSAVKHRGKPLYHYARRGITIEKEARAVTIHHLQWLDRRDLVDSNLPSIRVQVVCSKGTYIRQLAADIGSSLGCGSYLTELRRLRSGPFRIEQSVPGEDLYTGGGGGLVQEHMLSVEHVRKVLQNSDEAANVTC